MKRTFVVATGLIAVMAAGQKAQAKSLEDVLKEKGVISEADLKDVAKSKPTDYKPGKGFTFTSANEKFQLLLGTQVQVQYENDDYENPATKDVSQFNLRRVKTSLSGYASSKDLTYNLSYNWTNLATSPNKAIETANIKYRLRDEAQVMLGQEKIQFSRQWITSFTAQQFVDASFVRNAFHMGWDTGINLHGDLMKGMVKYDAGIFGGSGQNTKNKTNDNAYNIRLSVDPLGNMKYGEGDYDNSAKPLLSVGTSYYMSTVKTLKTTAYSGNPTAAPSTFKSSDSWSIDNNNGSFAGSSGWLGMAVKNKYFSTTAVEDIKVDAFEADLAFKWRGASLQGEYFWGQGEGQVSKKKAIAVGAYVQAGYFVIPQRLELAMRYAWLDPNRFAGNDMLSEIQGGVNYFFSGNDMKFQADVTNKHTYSNQADDMIYRAQMQFLF